MSARPVRRLAGAAVVALVLLCGTLGTAFADDAAPAPAPSTETSPLLEDSPTILAVKGTLALLGVGVLVGEYLRRDRIRGGLLPAPVPVEPTVPFPALQAIGIVLIAFFAVEMVKVALVQHEADLKDDLGFAFAAAAAAELPLAGIILLRRRRFGARPPLGASAKRGLVCFLASQALFLPVALLWAYLISLFGVDATDPSQAQPLVQKILKPTHAWEPWLIGAFGVLVAPVAEEAIFRGMLYPAFRQAAGGGRKGAWTSAVVTSLLFAAIHMNLLAAGPLFVLAMVLAYVMETTNSVLACTLLHAANNFVSLALVLWLAQ